MAKCIFSGDKTSSAKSHHLGYDEKIFEIIKPKIRKSIDDNNLLDYENGEDMKIIFGVSHIETIEHVNEFRENLKLDVFAEFIDKDFVFEQQEGEEQQQYIERMDSIMQKMQRQMKIKVKTDNLIQQIKSELDYYNGNSDCNEFIKCVNSVCRNQVAATGDLDDDLKTLIADTRRKFEQNQNDKSQFDFVYPPNIVNIIA